MQKIDWSIIVHGGAKTIGTHENTSHLEAIEAALVAGRTILMQGGSALDAAEQAVRSMEDGGVFNAGRASVRRDDGSVQMDASMMDGRTLDIGAIAGIDNIRYPVSVARALLTEDTNFLFGRHAYDFAVKRKLDENIGDPPAFPVSATHDTAGCVARDSAGNIAVALSTGGLSNALPGRIGDVPLPGCGFYADNSRGGVCCSGDGEKIARVMMAAEVIFDMRVMDVQKATDKALTQLQRVGGEAGCIAIDKDGRIGWSHNSSHFSIALQTSESDPEIYIKKKFL